jgi:hypothetical protein
MARCGFAQSIVLIEDKKVIWLDGIEYIRRR